VTEEESEQPKDGEFIDPTMPVPPQSTPLEIGEPEGVVPPAPLWAMKDRRHFFALHGHSDAVRVRERLGVGDDAVYFIDDGRTHCMVGRRVGQTSDGCVYCLVGRIKLGEFEDIMQGRSRAAQAFSDAHDVALCGVFEDDSQASDVILVQHYAHSGDVPAEYLPSNPFIEFDEDLPAEI
jgi:hypothetical protein